MANQARKLLILALKAAVAAALVWLLLRNADLAEVGRRIAQADGGLFSLGVAAMFVYFVIMTGRWRWLSRAIGIPTPLGRALLLYFEALTFNLVLPGSVGGEVLRVWRMTKLFGNLRKNIAVVLFERIGNIGFLSLLAAGIWGWLLLASVSDAPIPAAAAPVLAVAVVLALPGLMRAALRVGARWRRRRSVREIWRFVWIVRAKLFRPRALAGFAGASLLAYAAATVAVGAAIGATGAADLGAGALFTVAIATLVGASVPLSIAGTGFREGAMVLTLTHYGAAGDAALAAAFLFSAMHFLQAAPGLLVWLSGTSGRRSG